jgi:hypothetical protein
MDMKFELEKKWEQNNKQIDSKLGSLKSKVAMNKSESEVQIAELASKVEKTDLKLSKVKSTFEENQEEINLKLKENIEFIHQRTTEERLYAERQYERMQAEIGEIKKKLTEQSSIPSMHSVQVNKKELTKSEPQEEEDSEKYSEEENEMKEKTERTKEGKLTMGMHTSHLELPLVLFDKYMDNPVFHLKKLEKYRKKENYQQYSVC